MVNEYSKFLADKNDYWRKAKQHEYQDIDRIILALQNIEHFTTRNSMTLRILGLIKNLGNDSLELTDVGNKLIESLDKQAVLDEQLLKIYLASKINTNLNIPIFPLQIIYRLFVDLEYITFEEYKMFICWISDPGQLDLIRRLIIEYRIDNRNNRHLMREVFEAKLKEIGTQDMADNIVRLFDMFLLSSFTTVEGNRFDRIVHRNSSPEKYETLANIIEDTKFDNYLDFDYHHQGLINFDAEHQEITKSLQNLTKDERQTLTQSIKEKSTLPKLELVRPVQVSPSISSQKNRVTDKRTKSSVKKAYKPDYAAKENTNRIIGLFAEKIVVKFEYDYLISKGRADLANGIDHVSRVDDSLGYDILSFDVANNIKLEKHIEVKAVSGFPSTFRFFISQNELDKARSDKYYCLYIVFDYRSNEPKIWKMPNIFKKNDSRVDISPNEFMVTVTIDRSGAKGTEEDQLI